jgi:SAM-dependent methyltransferase
MSGATVSSGVHPTGPTDPETWDQVGKSSDTLPSGWRVHAREVHLALVRDWIGEPGGRWLKTDLFEERSSDRALLPMGEAAWIGLDLSGVVAGEGRNRARGVTVADVRGLPFRDRSFEGVLSTSTLDHFTARADIARSIREFHRVLVDGGVLVLTLDNPRNPLIRLRNALPYGLARRTGLVPFFVGETLDADDGRTLLEASGFEVVDVQHILHAPHVVGTRPARWRWYARRGLPLFDRLRTTRVAPWTGHFVAFLARRL